MEKPVSSEEKLLQLIRKKPETTVEAVIIEKNVSPKINPTEETAHKDKVSPEVPKFNFFGIIDIVLILSSLIIAGYMISKYLMPSNFEEKITADVKGREGDDIVARKLVLGEVKTIGPYLEKLRERDLFQSPWQQTKTNDIKGAANAAGADGLRQFKLVGVVLDSDPKAIIEDSQTKETLFVSKGQSVGPGVVDSIDEGKVLIKYNGQIVELVP